MGGVGGRRSKVKELRADRNAGDLGVAKPVSCRGKVDRRCLDTLADETVGKAGHRVRLEGHGGDFEPQSHCHRRAGGVSAHAKDDVGLEFADQPLTGIDAAGQAQERAQAGEQRDVLELAYIDEAQIEAGLGDKARLHTPRRTDEEHFGPLAGDQFASHGQRRKDVASGAASGDEYAQIRQTCSFQVRTRGLKVGTKYLRILSILFTVSFYNLCTCGTYYC